MLDSTNSLKIVIGRDVIKKYDNAMIKISSGRAELAMIEAKLHRMIPKLRREMGSDEAVLKWFAENFSKTFATRLKRVIKLK